MEKLSHIMMGGHKTEAEIPVYLESPTWVIDSAWDAVKNVAQKSLAAYMYYCKEKNIPHSYYLGLDILITAVVDENDPNKLVDIRPAILEGPCCNSYPASMDMFPYSLYKLAKEKGTDVDAVKYPVHPTKLDEKIVEIFCDIWKAKGHKNNPRVAIFTRSYPESEEEEAHNRILDAFVRNNIEVHRITPSEKPFVKDNKIWVHNVPIDMVFRRIERIHVPLFYGEKLGNQIINDTTDTMWLNNFKVDDLRSKTIEERAFRMWEKATGDHVPRPITLLDDEISKESVRKLCKSGGFVRKVWNSTGGKGVFINAYKEQVESVFSKMYLKYDGRHMKILDNEALDKELEVFENYTEDASIQQMRTIDSRTISDKERLVYDTRINVFYNEKTKKWDFLSGVSRVVPCGPEVPSGNSILTNVSSGAFMAPLIIGYSKNASLKSKLNAGPLLKALMETRESVSFF